MEKISTCWRWSNQLRSSLNYLRTKFEFLNAKIIFFLMQKSYSASQHFIFQIFYAQIQYLLLLWYYLAHAHNIKAVLLVARNIACPLLLCLQLSQSFNSSGFMPVCIKFLVCYLLLISVLLVFCFLFIPFLSLILYEYNQMMMDWDRTHYSRLTL